MSIAGGSAAKDGIRYEDRWCAHCAMGVLSEQASAIWIERLDAENEGFEFDLVTPAGVEHHQVKRQRTG